MKSDEENTTKFSLGWNPGTYVLILFWALLLAYRVSIPLMLPSPFRVITLTEYRHLFWLVALASPFAVLLAGGVSACGLRIAGLGALLFTVTQVVVRPSASWLDLLLVSPLGGLALGSLLAAWLTLPPDRRLRRIALMLLLPLFVPAAQVLLDFTCRVHYRQTFDLVLFQFDQHLGQPAFFMGYLTSIVPLLKHLLRSFYLLLPLAVITLSARRSASSRYLPAVVITTVLFYGLYFFFPVTGPRDVLGNQFWLKNPDDWTNFFPTPSEPRNGMPSLHFAWALLFYLESRGHERWIRLTGLLFLVGTVLSTLGLGYHWAADLIAAIPLTLLIWRLAPGERILNTEH